MSVQVSAPSFKQRHISPQPLTTTQNSKKFYKDIDKIIQKTETYRNLSPLHRVMYQNLPQIHAGKKMTLNDDDLSKNKGIHYNVQKYSNVMYILGEKGQDFAQVVEGQKKYDELIQEFTNKMKSQDFQKVQNNRNKMIKNVLNKIFDEMVQKEDKKKDGFKEIFNFVKNEVSTIEINYEKYINNMEDNFKKMKIFQDRDNLIITDLYQALRMLIECYNNQYKEQGLFGTQKSDQDTYIESLYHFKSLLKSDEKHIKYFKLFEDIESLLKYQYEKLDNLSIKQTHLQTQYDNVSKLYSNLLREKNKKNFDNIQNKDFENQPEEQQQSQHIVNTPQNRHGADKAGTKAKELLGSHFNSLKSENKNLKDKLNQAVKRITLMNSFTIKPGEQNEDFKNKNYDTKQLKSYTTADKAIQFTPPVAVDPISRRDCNISTITQIPHYFIKSANIQGKEWTSLILNMLITDKCMAEIYDEGDLRPFNTLHDYIPDWFLKKFGNKDMAEIFMKDFFFSLKRYGLLHDRIKLFCQMIGMDDLLETSLNEKELQQKDFELSRNKFKSIYLKTNEALSMYYKLCNFVRGQVNFHGASNNLPFLSNITRRSMDLVNSDAALKYWEQLLQEENFTKIIISDISAKYKLLHQRDIGQRPTDPFGVYDSMVKDDEDLFIRFDIYAKAVMDSIIDQRYYELNDLYNSLKLRIDNSENSSNISYDDFKKIISKVFPRKSLRWIELAYRRFTDHIYSDKVPLQNTIMSLIPLVVDEGQVKENFLKIKIALIGREDLNKGNQFNKKNKESKMKSKVGTSVFKNPTKNMGFEGQQNNEGEKEKEKLLQFYDPVTNLALMEETYRIIQPNIASLEKKQEALFTVHDKYKSEIVVLPNNIVSMNKYDEFQDFERRDLQESIEKVWQKMRKILLFISKSQ